MKKYIAIVIAIVCMLSMGGCSSNGTEMKKPVFETENITRITFSSPTPNSKETEVPSEYLSEITEWLGTFVAGKKADDVLPPGADSLFVKIEYADGMIVENSMSTIIVDGTTYIINCDKEPECYFDLFAEKEHEQVIAMPNQIHKMEISGYYNGSVIKAGDFVIADFDEFTTWFSKLSLEHRTFAEGKSPGEIYAGWNSYIFDINDGALTFTYADGGTMTYIVYDEEWYEVLNPSELPFK